MPEVKNIFVGAKMNKDLNPRMISNQEYIDARNAAIINSEGSDSGLLQNVSGNSELTNFGLVGTNLEIIGFYIDSTGERIFAFITDWTDSSPDQLSNFAAYTTKHYICVFNTINNTGTVLVSGNFLNFSKTQPIIAVNLLEDLLFFTDNRNQPRKINVSRALSNPNYYTKEEHISVAKYYPWKPMRLTELTGNGDFYPLTNLELISNAGGITGGPYSGTVEVTAGYTTSGSGTGALINVDIFSGSILNISVDALDTGTGFKVGDTITISTSVLLGASNDVVVKVTRENLNQTSSMKDVVSKNLPATETLTVSGTPTLNSFVYTGTAINTNWEGSTITAVTADPVNNPVISVSDNIKITTIVGNTINHDSFDTLSDTDIVTVGANPYYNPAFEGDVNYLSDKFARFSYRFKYDDGEYSLIAPFSQIAFIPKQDGYFLDNGDVIPTNINDEVNTSDENKAIKSTIISFFENKVNSIGLSIQMPEGVSSVAQLSNELKVSEIDILYKQSDLSSIRVVDTILVTDLNSNTSSEYLYQYTSQKPIKVLPSNESTRASDKVPIRAKAQEIAGNRVIYGNYLVRTARPSNLAFSVISQEKYKVGQNNSVNELEYPNSILKQNRSYKVGIVLVDKFGRQSDVIGSKLSTIYTPYQSASSSFISSDEVYRGSSLKINFTDVIPSTINIAGYAGLYSYTNQTGWYSYKIVVQQTEQDYYNVYIPTILNNNPQNVGSTTESNNVAFITLFSDNINKIPRDLNEVGPQDRQFSSTVEIFPRVSNSSFNTTQSTNQQVETATTPDKVVLIGTRDEIGLNKTVNGVDYLESPFYSIPDVYVSGDILANPIVPETLNLGANPYIGRVSTQKKIGAIGGYANAPVTFENVRLNVYETKPVESSLDIFYETTSSGLISDLNTEIKANRGSDLPVFIYGWSFYLSETTTPLSYVTPTYFDILNAYGLSLTSIFGLDVDVEIKNVFTLTSAGQIIDITSDNLFEVEQNPSPPYKFKLRTTSGTYFTFGNEANQLYKFVFKCTVNTSPENVVGDITVDFADWNPNTYNNSLQNAYPTVAGATLVPNGISQVTIPTVTEGYPNAPNNNFINLYEFDSANGTVNPSVSEQKKYVNWEVNALEFLWTPSNIAFTAWIGYGSGPGNANHPYPYPSYDINTLLRFVTNTTTVNEQLQWNSGFLRCINPDANTTTGTTPSNSSNTPPVDGIYIANERKNTQFRASVTVRDINKNSTGSLGFGAGAGGVFYVYFTMLTTN
jgi:hypothetical protein